MENGFSARLTRLPRTHCRKLWAIAERKKEKKNVVGLAKYYFQVSFDKTRKLRGCWIISKSLRIKKSSAQERRKSSGVSSFPVNCTIFLSGMSWSAGLQLEVKEQEKNCCFVWCEWLNQIGNHMSVIVVVNRPNTNGKLLLSRLKLLIKRFSISDVFWWMQ